jgi:hypothetical protein
MVRFVSFWDEKLLFIDVFFYILLAVHVSGALFIARTLNIQTWEHVRGRSKLHLETTKSEEKKTYPSRCTGPKRNTKITVSAGKQRKSISVRGQVE